VFTKKIHIIEYVSRSMFICIGLTMSLLVSQCTAVIFDKNYTFEVQQIYSVTVISTKIVSYKHDKSIPWQKKLGKKCKFISYKLCISQTNLRNKFECNCSLRVLILIWMKLQSYNNKLIVKRDQTNANCIKA
jgi:hypothetical protein